MIKLLAVDMDGTCLDSRSRMTERTLIALRRAASEGITVVPTTGRNLGCIPHRLAAGVLRDSGLTYRGKSKDARENRGLYRYVISSNGAAATDIAEKKTVFRAMMPREEALSLLEACGKIRLGNAAHICHRYLMEGKFLTMAGCFIYGKDAAGVYCVRNMREAVEKSRHEVEELQFYFLSGKAKEQLRAVMASYPELSAAYTGIYAEVYSKDGSKGRALAALRKYLGISREETACIGDGENDLSMFEAAGVKIAMGNAVLELKEKADYVTASNDRDGAAEAIEKVLNL